MISIIIPTYNRAHCIIDSINSVLNQTFDDFELIIVDDGSSDHTKEVIESIGDKRIRYIYQKNAGACEARNNGIRSARGEIIAFHDSDDLWRPSKLEIQVKKLIETDADILFCKMKAQKANGNYKIYPASLKEGFLDPVVSLFDIGTQTIIGKTEVFKETLFNPEIPRYQEFEMLYRASKKYRIYCLDQILVDYQIGADSISSNPKKLYDTCQKIVTLHPEIIHDYPVMAQTMACNLLTAAYQVKKKTKGECGKYIKRALSYNHSKKTITKMLLVYTGAYAFVKR